MWPDAMFQSRSTMVYGGATIYEGVSRHAPHYRSLA